MKKATLISGCVLFTLVVLPPLCAILSACFGYKFELASYSVFAVVTALAAVSTVILISKKPTENKAITLLLALTAPLSLINALFYLSEHSALVITSIIICISCCCYLTIRHIKPLAIKTIALVLSALMVLPLGFFGSIALLFGNFTQNTVVLSVSSPSGAYYAEVINSDQGALGGNTFVEIYENKCIDAFIFKISKDDPERVYSGNWGDFENMEIYWKNDHCLIINSVEYIIK